MTFTTVKTRLETDYLLPVPVGSILHIRTHLTGVDRGKVYAEATGALGGADGPVAVRAAALYAELSGGNGSGPG